MVALTFPRARVGRFPKTSPVSQLPRAFHTRSPRARSRWRSTRVVSNLAEPRATRQFVVWRVSNGSLASDLTCQRHVRLDRNLGHGWQCTVSAPNLVCVAGVTSVSWDQQFDDPIVLPSRKPLVTLRDAALYITKLPKAEHDAPEWRAAMEALLLVAERDGPTMLARIGMMRALNRHGPKPAQAPRKRARAYRIVR
jgi:hypothetical protein